LVLLLQLCNLLMADTGIKALRGPVRLTVDKPLRMNAFAQFCGGEQVSD
jgi:hypothetical protein